MPDNNCPIIYEKQSSPATSRDLACSAASDNKSTKPEVFLDLK